MHLSFKSLNCAFIKCWGISASYTTADLKILVYLNINQILLLNFIYVSLFIKDGRVCLVYVSLLLLTKCHLKFIGFLDKYVTLNISLLVISRIGVSKLPPLSQIQSLPVFVNKGLFMLFCLCIVWLLLHYNSWVE